eukprot:PhF_6_TR42096/c0_g1_i2/m.63540
MGHHHSKMSECLSTERYTELHHLLMSATEDELRVFLVTPIFHRTTHTLVGTFSHAHNSDLMIPLEYLAHGLCPSKHMTDEIILKYNGLEGIMSSLVTQYGSEFVSTHWIQPAVRRDIEGVVRCVLLHSTEEQQIEILENAHTVVDGERITCTILHLAAEADAHHVLNFLRSLLLPSSRLGVMTEAHPFVLRTNSLGKTPIQVVHTTHGPTYDMLRTMVMDVEAAVPHTRHQPQHIDRDLL